MNLNETVILIEQDGHPAMYKGVLASHGQWWHFTQNVPSGQPPPAPGIHNVTFDDRTEFGDVRIDAETQFIHVQSHQHDGFWARQRWRARGAASDESDVTLLAPYSGMVGEWAARLGPQGGLIHISENTLRADYKLIDEYVPPTDDATNP